MFKSPLKKSWGFLKESGLKFEKELELLWGRR
jgi:hypothetical protein